MTSASVKTPPPLPLGLLDKCIGQKLWVVMKGNREFAGKLRGRDDFFNLVMDDVAELTYADGKVRRK